MNRKAMAPLLLGACLLGFVAPLGLGLGGCGGAAELMGTETGNPPGIDTRRLRLEWTASGVELIGEAGAVPAGAEVSLRNSRTGESATGTANADGSIRLSVPGSLADPYEVTVSSGGGQATVLLSPTDGEGSDDADANGGMTPAGSTLDDGALPGGMPACASLEAALHDSIRTTFTSAPRECSADSDCVHAHWGAECYSGCGGQSAIAASAESATRALAEQRAAPICAELASCNREPPSCPQPPPSIVECVDGGCQARSLFEMSCEELGNQASLDRIAAMENADRACNVDADCALVGFGVRCFADCGVAYAVASSAVQRVQNDVETIESQFCGQFDAANCPAPVDPPCVPPLGVPTAACVESRCEVLTATLEP